MSQHRRLVAAVLAVATGAAVAVAAALPAAAAPASAPAGAAIGLAAPDVAGIPVVADARPSTAGTTVDRAGDGARVQAIGWPEPFLATGFGPVARATQVVGAQGRTGFYSPVTRGFSPDSGWVAVHAVGFYSWNNATIRGWSSLQTPFGPAVWATQYSGGKARWGIVNLITSEFFPDGDWTPVA